MGFDLRIYQAKLRQNKAAKLGTDLLIKKRKVCYLSIVVESPKNHKEKNVCLKAKQH